MRRRLLNSLGTVAAAAVLVLSAQAADARSKKKKQPVSKAPLACHQLKQPACKKRPDCIYTAVVMEAKTKTVRTKATCRVLTKEPAKNAEPPAPAKK